MITHSGYACCRISGLHLFRSCFSRPLYFLANCRIDISLEASTKEYQQQEKLTHIFWQRCMDARGGQLQLTALCIYNLYMWFLMFKQIFPWRLTTVMLPCLWHALLIKKCLAISECRSSSACLQHLVRIVQRGFRFSCKCTERCFCWLAMICSANKSCLWNYEVHIICLCVCFIFWNLCSHLSIWNMVGLLFNTSVYAPLTVHHLSTDVQKSLACRFSCWTCLLDIAFDCIPSLLFRCELVEFRRHQSTVCSHLWCRDE